MKILKNIKLVLLIIPVSDLAFGMLRNIPVYRGPIQTGGFAPQGDQYQFDMPRSEVTVEQKDQIMDDLLEDQVDQQNSWKGFQASQEAQRGQQDLLQNKQFILKNNFQQPQEVQIVQNNLKIRQPKEDFVTEVIEDEYLAPETKSTKKDFNSLSGNYSSKASNFGAIRRFNKSDKIDASYTGFRTDIGPLKNVGIRYFGELPLFTLSQQGHARSSADNYFDLYYPYYPLKGVDLSSLGIAITIVNNTKWRPSLVVVPYIIDLEIFKLYSEIVRSFNDYRKIYDLKQKFGEDLIVKYLTLINDFDNNYFKDIEKILLTSGSNFDISQNEKLIFAYKTILDTYRENYTILGHYYYLSMLLNQILYKIYYNNMREIIIKKR